MRICSSERNEKYSEWDNKFKFSLLEVWHKKKILPHQASFITIARYQEEKGTSSVNFYLHPPEEQKNHQNIIWVLDDAPCRISSATFYTQLTIIKMMWWHISPANVFFLFFIHWIWSTKTALYIDKMMTLWKHFDTKAKFFLLPLIVNVCVMVVRKEKNYTGVAGCFTVCVCMFDVREHFLLLEHIVTDVAHWLHFSFYLALFNSSSTIVNFCHCQSMLMLMFLSLNFYLFVRFFAAMMMGWRKSELRTMWKKLIFYLSSNEKSTRNK